MSDSLHDPTTLADVARAQLGTVGIWLSTFAGQTAAAEQAAAAELEALGYRALWIGESPSGKEAFVHSGLLLAATQRLVIGTGIANIWVRDAQATLNAADALGEAYPGRFVLGLGVSHAPLVNSRGHTYDRPLAAMRSYLDALDSATYGPPAPSQPVPRVLAALRGRMLALSRDRSAGAHPYLTTPEHTARARELLGPQPLLAPEQTVVLETDPARAREIARPFLAGYLAMPNYTNNFRELGFNNDDFVDGGSDRLVDALVAWGDEEAILTRVRAHHEAGADHVLVQPVGDFASGMAQLRTLAPALAALASASG